ncbi:hypothetical protein D3C76_1334320 [compost metagenome]
MADSSDLLTEKFTRFPIRELCGGKVNVYKSLIPKDTADTPNRNNSKRLARRNSRRLSVREPKSRNGRQSGARLASIRRAIL